MPMVEFIDITRRDHASVLTVTAGGSSVSGEVTIEQLAQLQETISNILDPGRQIKAEVKRLKNLKREAYMHFRQEAQPFLKDERLKFYLEIKELVADLEQEKSKWREE